MKVTAHLAPRTTRVIAGKPQGPQGIQGIPGTNGTDGTAATIAIGTVTTGTPGTDASVVNSGTSSAAVLDLTLPVVAQPIRRIHRRSGTTGLTRVPISKDSGDDLSLPHTLSVVAGRLRVTSDPAMTYVNRRECYTLDDPGDVADAEIRSTWYPPSTLNSTTCRPQMGHVHRAGPTGAIVIDQDQASTWTTTWIASWGWTGTSLTLGSNASAAVPGTYAQPLIRSWQRIAGTPATVYVEVDQVSTIAAGDSITITGSGVTQLDKTWTVSSVAAGPIFGLGMQGPTIVLSDAVNTTAVARTAAIGTVSYAAVTGGENPKCQYPFHVASRVIGQGSGLICQAKKWRDGAPEPEWGTSSQRLSQAWEADLSGSDVPPPSTGKCGLMANHLRGGAYMEYGDVTITRL